MKENNGKNPIERKMRFDDLEEWQQSETRRRLQELEAATRDFTPVSTQDWCKDRGIKSNDICKLLNRADFPVFRLGEYVGAYPEHMEIVLAEEWRRQTRKQVINRRTAKELAKRRKETQDTPEEE